MLRPWRKPGAMKMFITSRGPLGTAGGAGVGQAEGVCAFTGVCKTLHKRKLADMGLVKSQRPPETLQLGRGALHRCPCRFEVCCIPHHNKVRTAWRGQLGMDSTTTMCHAVHASGRTIQSFTQFEVHAAVAASSPQPCVPLMPEPLTLNIPSSPHTHIRCPAGGRRPQTARRAAIRSGSCW